jgi:ribonuclease HI
MDKITIYTDGACEPNPGNGGWAAIILYKQGRKKKELVITGCVAETTNNRMEMTAVLEGLRRLKKPCSVTIYSDSKYVINGLGTWQKGKPVKDGWIIGWQKRNWKRRDGPVLNKDIWQFLYEEVIKHDAVDLKFVKGHAGDHYNERCDVLAVEARLNGRPTIS